MAEDLHRAWALLFARLVLGLIFFMAGFWKVFQLGPLEHARKYFLPFSDTFLPVWSLWLVGVIIPFIELISGALVILGLRTRDVLIALGFVLVIVTFGHLLREPLYNLTGHVIPRLALLLFVLWCGFQAFVAKTTPQGPTRQVRMAVMGGAGSLIQIVPPSLDLFFHRGKWPFWIDSSFALFFLFLLLLQVTLVIWQVRTALRAESENA